MPLLTNKLISIMKTIFMLFILSISSLNFSFSQDLTDLEKNNEITLISVDEKTVFVLISTNGIVDQSLYSNSEEVKAHFLKTKGVIECSYSWDNNNMKLVLDKTNAKEILINTFGFDSNIISNLF